MKKSLKLSYIPRNEYRPFQWIRNGKGVSGWFSSEEAAQKWLKKVLNEDPSYEY